MNNEVVLVVPHANSSIIYYNNFSIIIQPVCEFIKKHLFLTLH